MLWHALARREWTVLAVVSPDSNAGAFRLARALAEHAGSHHHVLEVRDISEFKRAVNAVVESDARRPAAGASAGPWRFFLPIDSALESPHAPDLIAGCDTVVLLLQKGLSRLPDAISAVGLVGQERLLGAVLGAP